MQENKNTMDTAEEITATEASEDTHSNAGTPAEEITAAVKAEEEIMNEEIPLATDENGNYYPSTYIVYGMAVGVAVGAVLMNMTDSKLLLSLSVLIGTIIGYFIKKKNPEGDSHEK